MKTTYLCTSDPVCRALPWGKIIYSDIVGKWCLKLKFKRETFERIDFLYKRINNPLTVATYTTRKGQVIVVILGTWTELNRFLETKDLVIKQGF